MADCWQTRYLAELHRLSSLNSQERKIGYRCSPWIDWDPNQRSTGQLKTTYYDRNADLSPENFMYLKSVREGQRLVTFFGNKAMQLYHRLAGSVENEQFLSNIPSRIFKFGGGLWKFEVCTPQEIADDALCHILRCHNSSGCKILFVQPSEFASVSAVTSMLADGSALKEGNWHQIPESETVSLELPSYILNLWVSDSLPSEIQAREPGVVSATCNLDECSNPSVEKKNQIAISAKTKTRWSLVRRDRFLSLSRTQYQAKSYF